MYNQFFTVPDGELLSMVAGRAVSVRNANAAELITAIDSGAITGAAARKIAAVLELSRRLVSAHLSDNNKVSDSYHTFEMVKDMALLDVEHFDVIFLRSNNTVICRRHNTNHSRHWRYLSPCFGSGCKGNYRNSQSPVWLPQSFSRR